MGTGPNPKGQVIGLVEVTHNVELASGKHLVTLKGVEPVIFYGQFIRDEDDSYYWPVGRVVELSAMLPG